MGINAIVLAGGKGSRMKSQKPKVLSLLLGKPLIYWTLSLLAKVGVDSIVVVTGYKSGLVRKTIEKHDFKVILAKQKKLLGTAHATITGLNFVKNNDSTVLVLYGDDSALYRASTIKKFIKYHKQKSNNATLLTLKASKPTELGGIKRNNKGDVVGILTKSQMQKKRITTHEIVCGAFCFDKAWLVDRIKLIQPSVISGELPLTGIIHLASRKGEHVDTYMLEDSRQWNSINTTKELSQASEKKGLLL